MQRPTKLSSKSEIVEFLEAFQIEHDTTDTKSVLLGLIPDGIGDSVSNEDATINADANALALVEDQKKKQAELDYENSINEKVKIAKVNLDEAEIIVNICNESIAEHNIRLDEAKKAVRKAKDILGIEQKEAKLSKSDLDSKSKSYFERFENIEEIHATEDGTFFFAVTAAKEAKGHGAKVITFKR